MRSVYANKTFNATPVIKPIQNVTPATTSHISKAVPLPDKI